MKKLYLAPDKPPWGTQLVTFEIYLTIADAMSGEKVNLGNMF